MADGCRELKRLTFADRLNGPAHRTRALLLWKRSALFERIAAKERVILLVLSEEIPLLEAAARIRDLERRLPLGRNETNYRPEEMDEAEYYCAFVIRWAWMGAPAGPRPEVPLRLEAERDELRRKGKLRLRPPVSLEPWPRPT
jgi:hypothetical protein